MLIRRLIENDLEALSKLYKQFWNEESDIEKMKRKFKELKNNPKYIFLCAQINKTVVGAIMGIICESLYGECKPFLIMEDFIVCKDYRKRGIGKALLLELERIAKELNSSQILFITEAERNDAVSFYEFMGYNSKTHVGFKRSLK